VSRVPAQMWAGQVSAQMWAVHVERLLPAPEVRRRELCLQHGLGRDLQPVVLWVQLPQELVKQLKVGVPVPGRVLLLASPV
jgi:hypothetical protein